MKTILSLILSGLFMLSQSVLSWAAAVPTERTFTVSASIPLATSVNMTVNSVSGSTFTNNQTIGGNDNVSALLAGLSFGGAMDNEAILVLSGSTFDHNQAMGGNHNQITAPVPASVASASPPHTQCQPSDGDHASDATGASAARKGRVPSSRRKQNRH